MEAIRARVTTHRGTPLRVNIPHNLYVVGPRSFGSYVAAGTTKFLSLELEISTSSVSEMMILSTIPFDALRVQTLVITHYFDHTDRDSVSDVWSCTTKILRKLTKLTGLTSLIIQNPFPITMLRDRGNSRDLIADLRPILCTLDVFLNSLFENNPGLRLTLRGVERSRSEGEMARVLEFFPLLKLRDLVNVE